MPEKLLTIKEVSEHLGISEEEVKRLVDSGEIPAYSIGGSFLRFRSEQIDAIKSEISMIEKEDPRRIPANLSSDGTQAHPYTDLERNMKRSTPSVRQFDYTARERLLDFLYYNDFYIISLLIMGYLIYIIFAQG